MIESKTLLRCGLVWLCTFLFLVQGSRLLIAQENTTDKDDHQDSVKTESSSDTDDYKLPVWFEPDSKFTDENRTLFVRTNPRNPNFDDAAAEQALIDDSIVEIRKVLPRWLSIAHADEFEIDRDLIKSNLKVGDHWEFRRDLQCEAFVGDSKGSEKLNLRCGFAELRLDDQFKAMLMNQNTEFITRKRLLNSGLLGGSVLAVIAVAFGYLRMETATRGFYSRRLQTGSLVVVVLLVVLAYWIRLQIS